MATQGPMGSYNFRRIRVVPEVVLPGWCAKLHKVALWLAY